MRFICDTKRYTVHGIQNSVNRTFSAVDEQVNRVDLRQKTESNVKRNAVNQKHL